MEDLNEHLEKTRRELKERQEETVKQSREWWESIAPLCPECGKYLNPPKHICKKKGPENIFGYTCLWHCENGDCIYEKYTYQNAQEEMKKLIERRT